MSGLKKNWFYGLVEHCRDHICISVATLNSVRIEACAMQRRWKCRGGSVLSALDRLSPPLLEQGTEPCSEDISGKLMTKLPGSAMGDPFSFLHQKV